jgi:hypothetical protein
VDDVACGSVCGRTRRGAALFASRTGQRGTGAFVALELGLDRREHRSVSDLLDAVQQS